MTGSRRIRCLRCAAPLTEWVWCARCWDWFHSDDGKKQHAQWTRIENGNSRMAQWTLDTFPADDHAGRAALEAVEPWLWTATRHRILDGTLIPIDEEHPEPDIDHDEHPIWQAFNLDRDPNLYVWGGVGSGKSGLVWSLLRARVWLFYDHERRGEEPAWANVVQLLDKAKAAMSGGDGTSPIRELYDASVLVLDDLGAERPTDWARDAIAALVQHRHTRGLPTLVTSNYAPSALAKRLGHDDPMIGQRIVSRLTEDCLKVKLDRADLRLRKVA